ncbi:MAG: CoA-acylating methylmalonate-semialdehyde dehydrogenase [Deltaproteobacteria bacterium]|nr:MAG: CoA-acylating methylmalonate-semialdehyde dehydrogenase [Deltaproteobacteria bacterium]
MTHPTGPRFDATSYEFTRYIDVHNWIGGEWVPAAGGAKLEVVNPRHGATIGDVTMSDGGDIDRAVAAAKAAFPAWRATPMRERARVLHNLRRIMEDNIDELTWLLSHEMGKTFPEAKAEVEKGIECLEFGLSMPNMENGAAQDVSRGVSCAVNYEPLGVCAGITPFNFPIMVPMWMIPQVLVAGNTFVLKPSEKAPYGSMKLAHMLRAAGLPDGVFNVVNGARETVEGLLDNPDVKAIGFVGSTKVAKIVYARGAANGKRVLALGGAKNHLVLMDDAEFELATENIPASAFGAQGQRCMAASVLVAVGDNVQPFIDEMVNVAKQYDLGPKLGPVIDQAAVDRMTRYVTQAEEMGAKVLVDGRNAKGPGGGTWFGPTIMDHCTPEMPAGCEEIFGPVLSIIRVKTLDEAIRIENHNPYGNAAAIFTTNGHTARYAVDRFQAGMVGINIGVPVPREPFAFGGWNESKFGHGDITGYDGFRFWTRPRKVTTKWAKQVDQTWMG